MRAPRVAVLGAGTSLTQTAVWRACRDAGIDLVLLGGTDSPGDPDVPLLRLRRLDLRGPQNLWRVYPRLRRALAAIRPRVLHIHNEPWALSTLHGLAAARRVGAATAAHGADNRFRHGGPIERRMRLALVRAVLPRLGGYASWNSAGVRLARAYGLRPEAPSVVAPLGVPDPARFHPPDPAGRLSARARFGLPEEGIVVGFLGRLVPEKGVADALAAVRRLGEDAPFLAVWGGGPLEARLREQLKNGIRGRFGGRLQPSDVAEALHACDLVVVPSRTAPQGEEQFGRVAVEAQASGCAVIAYRSGALTEVLERGAALVPEGDIDGLSRAIDRLARDARARSDLVEEALAWVGRRWHPATVAADLVSLWERMLTR